MSSNEHTSNDSITKQPHIGSGLTVLIENPRKSSNWGPLLRCCAAFGISQIFVVGFDKCSVDGSHGASKHVELVAFHTHNAAVQALKDLGFELIGLLQSAPNAYDAKGYAVETTTRPDSQESLVRVAAIQNVDTNKKDDSTLPSSMPLSSRPFSQRTCFAVGKSAKGLPMSLARHCSRLVHIPIQGLPQSSEEAYVAEGWLTPEAGLSIALHEFSLWASRSGDGTDYQGQKYHVQKTCKGTMDPNDVSRKRKMQERQDARTAAASEEPGATFDPFGQADEGDY